MIAALTGSLRLREAGRIVVETGGVGYEIFLPLSITYYRLPAAAAAPQPTVPAGLVPNSSRKIQARIGVSIYRLSFWQSRHCHKGRAVLS
jgi:RuvA N terminal domain